VAVEIFVENLENLYLFERPKLDSRSAGVNVSAVQKIVCESAEVCAKGVLSFLPAEIPRNWRK